MATVRVRDDGPWSVSHPDHGVNVTLSPGDPWESDDIIVKEFRWAFQTDAERDEVAAVEAATAVPGEKRTTKRSR